MLSGIIDYMNQTNHLKENVEPHVHSVVPSIENLKSRDY